MSQLDEKALGRRLQAARQAAGLTQQALCQKSGLSYSTLAKIERGAIRTPSIFTIQSIAGVLGLSLDELAGCPARPARPKQRTRSQSGVSFVYFDINGCLVRFFHQAFTRIGADCDLPADVVETAFWHYNDQICRGSMTMQAFNAAIGKQLKLAAFDWTAYYLEAAQAMPGMDELVSWVASRYGVGLLTNIMPGLIAGLREHGLLPTVAYDAIIDSSEVHLLKPERGIYELAQSRAVCPPQEILFIDDARSNLMAAAKLGWHTLWFDDARPAESIARIREALKAA